MKKIIFSFVMFIGTISFTYFLLFNSLTFLGQAIYQESNGNPVSIAEGQEVKKPNNYLPPYQQEPNLIMFEVLFWSGDSGNFGGSKGSDVKVYVDSAPDGYSDIHIGTVEDAYDTDSCYIVGVLENEKVYLTNYNTYLGVYNDKEWFNNDTDYIRILFY